MSDQLILFTRYPEPGRVKTRLIQKLGEAGAAQLHRQLTEHCLQQTSANKSGSDLELTIFYTGGSKKLMQEWIPHIPLARQQGNSLGQKIATALHSVHTQNRQRVILFGADCPDLDRKTIQQALEILTSHDLVLGPAFDGGFYLIGINAGYNTLNLNRLLNNISWGTAAVLQETIVNAKSLGNSYGLLTMLHDIDTPDDLEHFHNHTSS